MPFVEGGIVVDAEPQQQAAPPMAQGGFVQGGIEVDPTPEDSYNKVLQYKAAQTDYTPTKQEFLDYLKVGKEKSIDLKGVAAAIGPGLAHIAALPYRLGEAIGDIYQPPEGATEGDVAAATFAETAIQAKLKAQSLYRGISGYIVDKLDQLPLLIQSKEDRARMESMLDDIKYVDFLEKADIDRKLALANAPQEQRVPASQEFLQTYNIPQEAIGQAGLEVGGFLADPSSIAFAGGGKLASVMAQQAVAQIPRAAEMLRGAGERVSQLGRVPENLAGRFTTKVTGSEQMGQAVQEGISKGTTSIAVGEAAGIPITMNVPMLGTASRVIGGTKAAGATMETVGEAGTVSGGPSLTPIQRGLLGAGERIAAAEGASSKARALGTALARSGLETPVKLAANILVPMTGAAAGGGLLAAMSGEEADAISAAIGSGAAFGAFEGGFKIAKAVESNVFNGARVRQTAVDDLNTRPTEVQFTYVDPVAGEQTSTIKDSEARATLYGRLNNKQLTKALSEVAGAEGAGVDVIFHTDADTVPTALQTVNYAGVAIGPDNIKSGKPTILINVDRAKPEALPHEILHARITQDMVSQLGGRVIDAASTDPAFKQQFSDFANRYADKIEASGGRVIADRVRTELRDSFDPNLQRAQQVEALKRITDEFSAYYTQEMLKGKDPKTMLPGRIPSFIEMALNNAKEAVSERFTRRALQAGFDPVARSFYDANGRRIKIPWMEDAIKNLVTPKEGYEPTEQKVDINKMTKAQQNALIMARGYSDLFMTAPDGSIVRPLSKAELAAKTADVANRTMKVVESVPQADRTSVSGMDSKGNPVIEGRLSLAEADAVSKSGIFSPSTSRSLIDIAMGIRDGTLMEGKYWKVYGPTGKSGVFGESEKLFLPYGISINSKGGVNVKVVDWGKVQARMYKALTKPAYKNLFRNYDQAMSTLKDVYLKNIAEQNAAPSAEALGGGLEGAKKRNFFNEVMGAVPKQGDVMSNLPTAGYVANRKGGSVYQDLRIERLQNTNPTGAKIPWTGDMGEQSSYRRTQLNFQPAKTIGETQVSTDQNAGYRILSKNGKFRLYGPDGSTAGIFDTEGQAKLKAEKDYATQARLQPEVRQQQYPARDEGRQAAEAGGRNRDVGRTQGREEGRQELGPVRQAGDVGARFMAASEADPSQPSTQAIRSVKGQRAVNSLYQFDYTYKTKTPGKPAREKTATETISAFSISEAKEKAKAAIMKELNDDPTVLRSTISISQPEIKGQFAVTELTGKPADPKSPKIVLNPGTPQKFTSMFNAVDAALDSVKDSPALGLDSDGWIKAYSRALNGSRASVPPAPLRLAQWVQDNGAFRKFIEDGLKRNPELVKSAVGGLNALQPIHELARQGQIPSKMVALHMFWGLLSRMLDPYNQEAGWARLTSDPKVLRLIEDSVEGRYKFTKDQWKEIVSTKMSEFPDVSVGRNAIQNANAFHEMLSRWNGRWDELTGIINNPDLTGPQMRRQFNEKGFGGAGIKHKVLSFVLATLARNDVFVGDRWQVVNLWFPHLEKAAAARKAQGGSTEVFAYDRNGVPEDTTGAYKVIGGMLNNETVAETAYSLIENGMRKIAAESPWLREMLGREPQPFDIHWLTWNIIKNEPVGHSSLDATAKFLTENLYGDPEFAQKFAETEKRTEKYAKGVFDVFSVKGQERPQIRQRPGADDGGASAAGIGPDAGRSPGGPAGPESARYLPAGGEKLYEQTTEQPGRRGDRGEGRYTSGNLAPLAGAPQVQGASGPNQSLVGVAEKYARDNGIDLRRQSEYVKVDENRARRIAKAYDEMPHAPQDPKVREAYQDLIRQTMDQYRALDSAGYKFWFIDINSDAGQQYASSPFNAMRDLRANKSMGVFPTDSGFGTKEDFNPDSNPMLAETGLRWPFGGPNGELRTVYANDLFRAVHDAFGHGLEGSGFRAQGEENAWQAHIRLFTGPARGAITTETRGQNSWLNYGPYGERNRTAKTEDTVFADQKTGLMPEWTWTEGRAADEAAPSQGEVGAQRYMPSDTDYLSAVQKGDTKAAQRMVDEAAKAAGYTVGPVYHGTPTGGFNVFDKRMRDETSGVSREAFSFTTNQNAAENYSKRLGDEAVRLDAGLRVANDAMRRFDDDVAAQEYFSSKGYTSVEDGMLPEFDWGSIEDVPEFIKELRGYAKDLKPINPDLATSFIEAAKVMSSTKAVPEVKRVFLRIPQNAPVFQATPATLGMVMRDFSAEREPTKSGIVELPGNERIYYVADSSQVKLADPVTKDAQGNVIPLSRRFKATSEDIRYMPQPDSSMPGAYSFQGGYRAIPGKTKGSLRLYGPAGSLIGIAASLDEAQRILRRKAKQ